MTICRHARSARSISLSWPFLDSLPDEVTVGVPREITCRRAPSGFETGILLNGDVAGRCENLGFCFLAPAESQRFGAVEELSPPFLDCLGSRLSRRTKWNRNGDLKEGAFLYQTKRLSPTYHFEKRFRDGNRSERRRNGPLRKPGVLFSELRRLRSQFCETIPTSTPLGAPHHVKVRLRGVAR